LIVLLIRGEDAMGSGCIKLRGGRLGRRFDWASGIWVSLDLNIELSVCGLRVRVGVCFEEENFEWREDFREIALRVMVRAKRA
jgi:hypothetical protein